MAGLIDDAIVASGVSALADLDALRIECRLTPEAELAVAPLFNAAFAALPAAPYDAAPFGEAFALAAIGLGDNADPALLAAALADLGPPVAPPRPRVSAASETIIRANAEAMVALASAGRALALAESAARRMFADRPEAVAARAEAAAVVEEARDRLPAPSLDLARDLALCGERVSALIARRAADLAPLITIETNVSLPAVVLAHRLYNDPALAEEMVARAGAPHPAFMPRRFTAKAF